MCTKDIVIVALTAALVITACRGKTKEKQCENCCKSQKKNCCVYKKYIGCR